MGKVLIDWEALQRTLLPTVSKVFRKLQMTRFAEISLDELLHEGLIGVVEEQLTDASEKAQCMAARRWVWDFVLRSHCPVSLPGTADGRWYARRHGAQGIGTGIDLEVVPGRVEYEDALLTSVDLSRRFQAMQPRPQQMWRLLLMGYTVREIAEKTGLARRSVSKYLQRGRLVPRRGEDRVCGWTTGPIHNPRWANRGQETRSMDGRA